MDYILRKQIWHPYRNFFPNVNLRKLYEVEQYHQKLAKLLDAQFSDEKVAD
ncbi:hypothetical protein HMPREF1150_0388 [Streptococcus sp. AS14]|nr:hypothetical protein HMPREF1150_0388 [Streptococcus sp. AS14]